MKSRNRHGIVTESEDKKDMRSSLRLQLVLGTWLLLVVALLPPFFYFGHALHDDIYEEANTRAQAMMNSARWMLHKEQGPMDVASLTQWASEMTDNTGARFSYIVDGKVLVDTNMTPEELAEYNDHSLRPEIMDANRDGQGVAMRYSTTTERNYIYIAEPLRNFHSLQDGIVRIALPVLEKQMHFSRMESSLLLAFVTSLVASGLLSFFVTRPFLTSIEALARTAQAIGQGDYARRIRANLSRELRPLAHAINGMGHNIESHLYSIEEQKGRLEAVFNGMCEAVMVLDSDGRITSMNRALMALFPNIEGKMGHSPLEGTMRPSLQQAVDIARSQESMEPRTIVLDCPPDRIFEVNLVPFLDASGRCMVLVFHDISEKEKLERMRRDFVANVSHELKTPLTSIKGYSEALLELPDQAPHQRDLFLETIARNADHMTKMVTSLLTLAKSEHKGEQRNLATIDACHVLDDCFDSMQPASSAKSVEIIPDYDEELFIRAEEDGLSEVFRNLLDNAIKYSPEGSHVRLFAQVTPVGVPLSTAASSQRSAPMPQFSGPTVLFRVEDQGVGIPLKSQLRIFERFYRLEGEASKDGSAGLGLAICRRLVKSYSGEIWVESPINPNTGNGAAFCVAIPLAVEKD